MVKETPWFPLICCPYKKTQSNEGSSFQVTSAAGSNGEMGDGGDGGDGSKIMDIFQFQA